MLEGEGMLRMRDYTPAIRDWLAAAAERAGHPLRRGLRSGFATDALIALKAGYPTARAGRDRRVQDGRRTTTRQRDVAANLDLGTVAACDRGLPRGGPLAQPARSSRARLSASSRRARSRPRSGPPRAARAARRAAGRARCRARAPARRRARAAGAARPRAAPAPGRAPRAPARGARAIAGLGVAAARGEPVGDREDRHVGRVRARSRAGSARPRAGRAARSWTRKPSRRWCRHSAATWSASFSDARSRRSTRAGELRALAVVAGEAECAPSGPLGARLRLGGVVQQRGEAHRVAARELVGERLGAAARRPPRRARRTRPRAGRARSRRPGRAPRACGRARRGGGRRSAPRRAARAARAAPAP